MKTLFGKSLTDIASLKSDFMTENDQYLTNQLSIYQKYNQQIIRINCKNCSTKLKDSSDIENHGIKYKICRICGHFNGEKEDSLDFAKWLYQDNDGENYSDFYLGNYQERVSKIYLPKAQYLKDSLKEIENLNDFSINDFGCGGGHFVFAANLLGIKASGFDISNNLINTASKAWKISNKFQNNPPFLALKSEDDLISKIKNSDTDVLSFIGVLEHLTNPQMALEAFLDSKAKYLYFSVPLFSLSVFVENIHKNTFPRQISGGHTHLYTHESINYFCNKYSFKKISQWHFGTDVMDLRRSMINETCKNGTSEFARKILEEKIFTPDIMNKMQLALDENFSGSEIHMLISKNL